jgi:zinc protease
MKNILVSVFAFVFCVMQAQAMVVPKAIKTPKGLTAWYVEDKNTPVIAMNFLFKGGARLDPAGKAGVADLTADLLESGTMSKDPNAFDAYLQDYAIQLDFKADDDQLGGSLATLVQYKDQGFGLLKEVLTSPRFKEDVFEITKAQALTALANAAKDPNYQARRKFDPLVFQGHAYEQPTEGVPETIKAITLKDIETYHKTNLTKDRLLISINGNISEKDAIKLIDETFGHLPDKATKPLDDRFKPKIQGQTEVVDLAIPQSVILFALPGIMYDDPDFIKASLFMHIMGTEQAGRLFNEIREKRGLAYAVGAGPVWKQEAGYFAGMVGTTKDKAAESIKLLRSEWAKVKQTGITQEELDGAKKFLLHSYPLNFNSSAAISKMLLGYQLVHRPLDYFQKREAMIQAITLKEMNEFITKVLQPDKLTMVIVGRPEGMEPKNEATGTTTK